MRMMNNLFQSLLGIMLALILIEIFLRALNVVPLMDQFVVEDGYVLYHLKPNISSQVINADGVYHDLKTVNLGLGDIGFRDDGIDDEPYAIALGDSFTMAVEVSSTDSWTELLEGKLGKDVANMGLYGYGGVQEKRMLERYGVKLKPKIVLWGFFINDFSDDFEVTKTITNTETFGEKLYRQFAIVRYVWNNLGKAVRTSDTINYTNERIDIILWPNQWRYLYPVVPDSQAVQFGEIVTKQNILEAKELADSIDAEFVLILFPSKDQVYWDYVKNDVKGITYGEISYPINQMKEFCQGNNIRCLDLTPLLTRFASEGVQLHFKRDGHLNEEGNSFVASEVFKYLTENNLVS